MSRTVRLLVILAAWAIPVVWVVMTLVLRPSDGSVVWRSPLTTELRWSEGVSVVEAFGDTPLEAQDQILSIEGQPVTSWLAGADSEDLGVGDEVHYLVGKPQGGLVVELERTVTLTRFPVAAALAADLPLALVAALLMASGGLAFFLRPGLVAAQALLGATSLLPAGIASARWGVGAIDLAGGRGLWPHLAAEALCTVGLGLAVLSAVTWRTPRGWLSRRPWLAPLAVILPFTGYAAWAAARAATVDGPDLTQSLLSVAAPSLLVAAPAVLVALAATYRFARSREVRLSSRLALLVLVSGLAAWVLLGAVPERVAGNPVLPWDVLLLLIAPPVLAGVVVSLIGYRLDDIEPVVRRSVVQGAVAAAVGTAFVVVADTVGRATDVPVGAILAGGVVALLVLPLALALQRGVRRLVYGERDLPRTVVSELRRLDATSAPTEAVAETLELLARRLRLSYAAIDVPASDGGEPLLASVGESFGQPVTVDLVAGGIRLGTLHLEAGPDRDAFGRGDRLLLEDVGAQVGALVQAVLANRDLMRSRHELVSAREEERRRLRRDLHDGLGPSLATLALRLENAEDLISTDPVQAAELVGSLADLARDEIAEVRRLVEGLRPPALDQLGLVSALRQRAAQHELAAGEGDVVWTVEAERDVEPLPAAVEVAAYRIVLEAVTNAVRHGGGHACTVTLRREDGHLRVLVQDDGHGLVVGSPPGVGLFSMRERAQELGGTCTISSTANGTLVDAVLPVAAEGIT